MQWYSGSVFMFGVVAATEDSRGTTELIFVHSPSVTLQSGLENAVAVSTGLSAIERLLAWIHNDSVPCGRGCFPRAPPIA